MTSPPRRGPGPVATGILGGAALIAGLSLLSRVVGFARQIVFQDTIGETALGSAYGLANAVPNVTFEIVAGGALASAVVPLLAARASRGEHDEVRRTASALLGWVLVGLVPIAVLGALLARPIAGALLGSGADPVAVDVAARLLVFFMPQIPLYGIAVVTAGVLQAHRRFFAAAAAPIASSLVVAGAYLLFGAVFTGDLTDLTTVDTADQAVLGVGTTLGALALALITLVPVLVRVGRIRPTLRFPPGVAKRAGRLALAGLAGLVAQQLAYLLSATAATRVGGAAEGGVITFTNTWMIFLLPYAVLALPIVTAAFPRLSEHAETHDQTHDQTHGPAAVEPGGRADSSFARVVAGSTRAVLAAGLLGGAVLVAAAWPVARFFESLSPVSVPAERMAWALTTFAPAVLAFGLVTHLSRALYARGRGRAGATGTVLGWGVVIGLVLVLPGTQPDRFVVATIGAAHSIGLLVGAAVLARAVLADGGAATMRGVPRTALVGLLGAGLGAVAGRLVAQWLHDAGLEGVTGVIVGGVAAAAVATIVASSVLWAGDRSSVRAVLRR